MVTAIVNEQENLAGTLLKTHQTNYTYDQLQRIKSMDGLYQSAGLSNEASGYSSDYSFDQSGNLATLKRTAYKIGTLAGTETVMDDFVYHYDEVTNGGYNNQLSWVDDLALASVFGDADIDVDAGETITMASGNYSYDEIGQLEEDVDEGILAIEWTVTNKVAFVRIDNDYDQAEDVEIHFDYDPMGNRIAKHVTEDDITESTFYALDAQGNQLAIYSLTTADDKLFLSERNLYGASRLGQEKLNQEMLDLPYTYTSLLENEIGDKSYQLANHLGNVLEVVTDRKLPIQGTGPATGTVASYTADVISYSDYYPIWIVKNADKQ